LFGADFRVTAHRGEVLDLPRAPELAQIDPVVIVTIHPSAVLRTRGAEHDEMFGGLVHDLRLAAGRLGT